MTIYHTISARTVENRKACHEYVFDGRSLASKSARRIINVGMICCIILLKFVQSRKNGKYLSLQALQGVRYFVASEANYKARTTTEKKFGPQVRRRAPVVSKTALREETELSEERSRKVTRLGTCRCFTSAFAMRDSCH